MRPSWVEVDLEAIEDNVAALAAVVAPARMCAVVKADGYGHGDVPVAEAALRGGAHQLAVALVEEGIRLREAGIEAPILVLAEPPLDAAPEFGTWSLEATAYRSEFVKALIDAGTPVPVQVKVDTGMHRVGADRADAGDLAELIDASPLRMSGLWSHFPVAEEDREFTLRQISRFQGCVDAVAARGIDPGLTHIANTAGAIGYPEARFDMVRCGIGIYGLRPEPGYAAEIPLRPAMRVVSHVSYVRRLPAGWRPSYGRRRPLATESTVVTVPIGYADGVPRRLSDGGEVLIGGRRHPLAGTITMDQIVVDVGDHPVSVGDEVVVLGAQGDEAISADDWAAALGTINYEIVCGFGPRLPRRYP